MRTRTQGRNIQQYSFSSLPDDFLGLVIKHLPLPDKKMLRGVCRRLRALVDAQVSKLLSLPEAILMLVIDQLSSPVDKKTLRSVCCRLRALVNSKVSSLMRLETTISLFTTWR